MNILIADSGSTKTEWCHISGGSQKSITTEGLNTYYHTPESISKVLRLNLQPELKDDNKVEAIYFYGAGCDSAEKKEIIFSVLCECFEGAKAKVYHDLLGAARACFFDEPGIACILGTGSNSCLFDGEKIVEHIPSLGFILGDEGSAGYFGKQLINAYFRDQLPADIKEKLETTYPMSLETIMTGTYQSPLKSRFIASYAAFLGSNSEHPFVLKLLKDGFSDFIKRIVKNYSGSASQTISFVGSVAYAHRNLIASLLEEQGLKAGLFVEKPMQRLVEFHTQKRK